MELSTLALSNTMRRPCLDEVGLLGEVRARIYVPVAGRHNRRIPIPVGGHEFGDPPGHRGAPVNGERAAFTEVVLYVDHDKSALCHGPEAIQA